LLGLLHIAHPFRTSAGKRDIGSEWSQPDLGKCCPIVIIVGPRPANRLQFKCLFRGKVAAVLIFVSSYFRLPEAKVALPSFKLMTPRSANSD
jgi:hypothetical protein